MKSTSVLLTILAAVIIQVTLARYAVGGRWVFDFVLVGVVFAGLQWGPVAGILGGTVGGLLQDVLAGQVVGVGGLAKTVTGCLAGIVGTQFVLNRPHARTIIVAAGTLVHRLIMLGLGSLVDQHWSGVPWGAMLAEMGINTFGAWLVFQATFTLPGAIDRRRMNRRTSLSRRQW